MKIVISESQYNRILKEEKEQKVLHIPSLKIFSGDWDLLQKFLKHRGNPPYSIGGNLNLVGLRIESLRSLVSVEKDLYAYDTPLESLGNLTSVGGLLDLSHTPLESLKNLTYVGGGLVLGGTPIKSLGNLQYVGDYLDLYKTPLSTMYSEKQIRQMVDVGGVIFM
jgi:hypothetical protein